jgi:hypothetical protein
MDGGPGDSSACNIRAYKGRSAGVTGRLFVDLSSYLSKA